MVGGIVKGGIAVFYSSLSPLLAIIFYSGVEGPQ